MRQLVAAGIGSIKVADDGRELFLVNRGAVLWTLRFVLSNPLQHHRSVQPSGAAYKSKMFLLMGLHMNGWRPNAKLVGDWGQGQTLEYRPGFSQPASYFRVLLCNAVVLAKGVQRILHCKSDAYYKCLLCVPAEKLIPLLDNLADYDNATLVLVAAEHKEDGCASDPEDGGPGDVENEVPPAPLEDLPAAIVGDNLIVPPVVLPESHSRVIVDCGEGTPSVKVYFDHFSGGGSRQSQRGFVDCREHGCICYRPAREEKRLFCARMYSWWADAANHGTKNAHLSYTPSDESVAVTLLTMRMQLF